MAKRPVVLMILDGWGLREAAADNAISQANPVHFNQLLNKYPSTCLSSSGQEVGLPRGQMGNSEVGHLNMGAGRVVYQEITRISNAIEDKSFFTNPVFLHALEQARNNNGAVHLMGLLSDGGVHSHMQHLFALLQLCKQENINKVYIHGYLDGRDVNPRSALVYINQLQEVMNNLGIGEIATLSGRYYGMDRDKHWDRVEATYQAMVLGEGNKAPNAYAAIESSYELKITDEFMEPVVIVDLEGKPTGQVKDGDSLIFFNFRADRARQITRAFVDDDFSGFERQVHPRITYVCMTQYDASIQAPVAYAPQNLNNTLGEYLSSLGIKQLRIAETEKYAHVTFFFNGGVETANPGEDRILIPSPQVATYNLKPAMSAREVTDRVLLEMDRDYYDVIIMNFANPDMVGHTGVMDAAVTAVQVVDDCLGQIVQRILEKEGSCLITADHGNCEMMVCPVTGSPYTAHTTDLVPFILVSDQYVGYSLRSRGELRDIAPTLLTIMNLPIPEEMTGKPLFES